MASSMAAPFVPTAPPLRPARWPHEVGIDGFVKRAKVRAAVASLPAEEVGGHGYMSVATELADLSSHSPASTSYSSRPPPSSFLR